MYNISIIVSIRSHQKLCKYIFFLYKMEEVWQVLHKYYATYIKKLSVCVF